jgi:primosomal protein N' (replication factor Y)
MTLYAGVLPDPGRALSRLFTYRVPEHLQGALQLGSQVLVPFGPRTVMGLVLEPRRTPSGSTRPWRWTA